VIAVTLAYIHEEWPAGSVGRATAAYVSGTVFGGFIGRAIVGVLADRSHWWTGFVVIAAVSFVCAVVVLLTLPRDRQGRTRPPPGTAISLRAHATNRELLVTYAVGFCILFTQVAVFTYVTFPLSAPPFGLSSAELGWIFAVYLVGAVITPIAGRWIDRRGARVMIAAAMAIGTAGALLTLAHGLPIVIAGLALCCTSVFIAQSTASSHLGTAARDNRGLAIGLYASCYYLGGTAGSALPALFWNLGGWPACVALIVAVQVATAAIGVGFWEGRPASPYEEVEPVP
jgi:predicted MFS family arabinose efflux permease